MSEKEKQLTFRERIAWLVLGKLRFDMKTNTFNKGRLNKSLLKIGGILLKHREPIEFVAWMLNESPDNPIIATLR